ncbi:hypothetical protein CCH79_00017062 [Gambusia affinis]|uniref:Transmembrane BAX inhibitor motif-containing protein 6 n=1 Tax=Gambusia affinis TaxID=33528 RepID=A0A315W2H2_GAMAF|nr:hypothetical protein CCH79_00017062 [Gambusia affinis]
MNVFDRNINIDALFKFSQMYVRLLSIQRVTLIHFNSCRHLSCLFCWDLLCRSHSTQVHLKNVYSSLAVCMFVAAAGSYVHVVTRLLQVGVGLGPTLDFVIAVNPSIIMTAFLGTSVIFVCFTLSALYAKRRSYLFLGGTLMSGLSILFLMSLMNIFFGSLMLFKVHMYLGLFIMCGFVLFDTQLIIEKAENGDKDYVWHCVDLFLDFITIFRKLMIILALNDKDKKKEKK